MAGRHDDEVRALRREVGAALDSSRDLAGEHPSEILVAAWLDGGLSEQERVELETHLATCARCTEEIVLIRRNPVVEGPARVGAPAWRIAAGWILVLGSLLGSAYAGRMLGDRIEVAAIGRLDGMLGGRVAAARAAIVFDQGPALVITGLRIKGRSDSEALVAADRAILRPNYGALVDGSFRGELQLIEPTFTIIKNSDGRVTVDSLLPGPTRPDEVRKELWRHRLERAWFENATLRFIDRSNAAQREVVATGVSAEFTSLAGPGPITIRLDGKLEAKSRNLSLRAEVIGPRETLPRFEFSQVSLEGVPTWVFGSLGEKLKGQLSFKGSLASHGTGWDGLFSNLSGRGEVVVGPGSLVGLNLLSQVITPLLEGAPREGGIAELLVLRNTPIEGIRASIKIAEGGVFASRVAIEAEGYSVVGKGRVTPRGTLVARGTMTARPDLAAKLVALKPALSSRVEPDGRLTVAFRISGSWAGLSVRLEEIAPGIGSAPVTIAADTNDLQLALRHAASGFRSDSPPAVLTNLIGVIERAGPLSDRELTGRLKAVRSDEVLLTGYYEPILDARKAADERFRYPIYSPPLEKDDREMRRSEIAAGVLRGKGLEIFWVDDPIALYFLHIQGSGRLRLADGSLARVGYAASNGHDYESLGGVLIDRGYLTRNEATAPGIEKWLRSNPRLAAEMLATNPRYIYFRRLDLSPDQGPIGSLGVPLVAWRSVAADPLVTPPGSIGRLRASLPDGRSLDTLVVAMDSGAAIRGPGRLDLFLGLGQEAGRLAGLLRSEARIDWLAVR